MNEYNVTFTIKNSGPIYWSNNRNWAFAFFTLTIYSCTFIYFSKY